MHNLLTQAAELRAVGHPWEGVAKHVHRKPGTCQKWMSHYRCEWERLDRHAQLRRFEETSNESHSVLKALLRNKDARTPLVESARLVSPPVIDEHHHRLAHRYESRQQARVVPPLGDDLGRLPGPVHGLLQSGQAARRLDGHSANDRHPARNAAEHPAVACLGRLVGSPARWNRRVGLSRGPSLWGSLPAGSVLSVETSRRWRRFSGIHA